MIASTTQSDRKMQPHIGGHAPDERDAFVLMTCWDTLVCIEDVSGALVHRDVGFTPANLVFWSDDTRISVSAEQSAPLGAHQPDLSPYDHWVMNEDTRTGLVTIRINGRFACAEPNGEISTSRDEAHDWEMFKRTPLAEARSNHEAAISRRKLSLAVPRFKRSASIPAILHQTYPTHHLPPALAANAQHLRDMNPGYAYRLWDDQGRHDFIYEHYGYDILSIYLSINPHYGACRADLFRYLCIYKLGGVYLDIKSGATTGLATIIRPDDTYLLSQWPRDADGALVATPPYADLADVPGGEFQQWHVIGAAGHPFLETAINDVLSNIRTYHAGRHDVGRLGALRVTGPITYTRSIRPLLGTAPHRFIEAHQEGLVYNMVENHYRLFTVHYTSLRTPIVY